jgi:hypothetical protein
MERTDEARLEAVQRCPFCHDSITIDTADQVACKRCLARHHLACWNESGSCGACRATEPLVSSGSARLALPADTARAKVASAFEEADLEHARSNTIVFAILTGGLYGLFGAEVALSEHLARNREEEPFTPESTAPELGPELDRARRETWPAALRRYPRTLLAMAVAVVGLLNVFVEGNGWPFQLLAVASVQLWLHLFRETVQRHDRGQAFLRLVADAPGAASTKKFVRRATRAWTIRRAVDTALSLAALAPWVGLATIPLAAIRAFGALRLHERHEASAPRPRRRAAAAKDTKEGA